MNSIQRKGADRSLVSRCRDFSHSLGFINGSAASFCAADTAFVVGMQRRLVIDRDFFARLDVAQRNEENVVVKNLHECVGQARVINVVRSVSAATSVKTPATIDFTDP